jgi:5-methylcytosine-specific restriction endonuclease McrA
MATKNSVLVKAVAKRDGWDCHYCNKPVRPYNEVPGGRETRLQFAATLEHIVPQSQGGTNDMENLVIACFQCNASKHARPRSMFGIKKWANRLLSSIRIESM